MVLNLFIRPYFGADDAKVAKEASPEIPAMLVLDENGKPVPLVDLQAVTDGL
jgi:isoleucyl-tRNA synthetase